MSYYQDKSDEKEVRDKYYAGEISGMRYEGCGTYSNKSGNGSDLYVVKNDDGTTFSVREM